MSEPVSNAEIEDVLSSIRRLVSENGASAQGDAHAGVSSEKLVLTPAFRVLGGQGDTRSEVTETQPNEDAIKASEPQPDSGLEARIAELESAIDNTYEEWEPDGSEEALSGSDPIILNHAPVVEVENTDDNVEASIEAPDEMIFTDHEDIAAGVFDDEQDDPVAETSKPDAPAEDDVFLDEDSLRDMVAQLVREELHGHVGERITRNVRRLVRREIKRALAIRELE